MKKLLFTTSLFFFCSFLWAQELHTELFFQFHGINENQIELEYISFFLQNNNLTTPSPQYEQAIMSAHDYYINHKEELDIAYKTNELLEYRSARKAYVAAAWGQALSYIAAGIPSVIAGAQQQHAEYQEKLNRERKIQDYIRQYSSTTSMVTPQQNFGNSNSLNNSQQNFGNSNSLNNSHNTHHVTTSNGYETPLPSSPTNNSISNISNGIESSSMPEKVIQAVYVQGSQLVSCRLRLFTGRITAYSTSKNIMHQEEWNNIYPESPRQTVSAIDGNLAEDYKYTINSAGMKFYFNM